MMKKLTMALAAVVAWAGFAETVTNVRGIQRAKSNLVDIYYDLEADAGGTYTVKVSIEGKTDEVNAATFSGDVGDGIAPGKDHHIVWDAGADWPKKKGDVKAVVTVTKYDGGQNGGHGKVQLWEGGPYWADRNIGANAPEGYGLYFWWGDTVGYMRENDAWVASDGSSSDFSFSSENTPTYNKTFVDLECEGWGDCKDGTFVLAPEHDAAHVHWGGGWRMPTYGELLGLIYNCDWIWRKQNGVYGFVVSGRGDYSSNSIFLPCAGSGYLTLFEGSLDGSGLNGRYWSSWGETADFSYSLNFYYLNSSIIKSLVQFSDRSKSKYNYSAGSSPRYDGLPVRPVQGFTN